MPQPHIEPVPPSGNAPRETPKRPVRSVRRETTLLVICILLLLLATIPPLINLGRYQRRIAVAISRSIGRPVSMGSISLRLLPWPAFQIDNLVVSEDLGFGAEPALLAPEVIVEPRLSSLWRGRFELSRVELTDASVNLVRRADGRWNISSVLLQASHMQNAPTGQKIPGPAPRFPYIEATGTRVNLKRGAEKLPYSLLNADFSMWLARPDVWQLKLEGQPVRTDLDLSLGDTGLLHIEGELHRASALGAMPLTMTGEWSHAPLGQLSRLLLGRDGGWRGDIDLTARVRGEADHLDLHTHLVILNLHRQEFTPDQPFAVDATCDGRYSRSQPQANLLHCRWPVGAGALTLSRTTSDNKPGSAQMLLSLDRLPASFLASALGLIRPGTPRPQRFTGNVSGSFGYDAATGALAGDAAIPRLQIAGAGQDGAALVLTGIAAHAVPGPQPSLAITGEPVNLGVLRSPLAPSAELTAQGYTLHASGGATLPALAAAAGGLHLPSLADLSASGSAAATAQVALTTSGTWSGGDTPETARVAGSIRLENVQWSPPWLPVPVHLAVASASVAPGIVRWSTPAATLVTGNSLLRFAAEAAVPMDCTGPPACRTQFSLRTDALDAQALQSALSTHRPMLSALLDRMDAGSRVALPDVTGSVHAGVFTLGRLAMHDATATLSTDPTAPGHPFVRIESLDGRTLGGTVHVQGTVHPGSSGPRYSLRLLVAGINVTEAAALWHEGWGPGTLGGTAEFSLAGSNRADLLDSIKGSFRASWLHSTTGGPLSPALHQFASWDGSGTLAPEGIELTRSTLSGTPATVSGSIGWDRTLHLDVLIPGESPEPLSGTLAAPEELPVAADE